MADVSTINPEVAVEDSERNTAAADALRSDASLEDESITTPDTASEHLPSLIIANGTEETPKDANGDPTYTAAAALVAANDLSTELHKGKVFGIGGPSYDVILSSFSEKTPDQILRMKSAYELNGGNMMADIKSVVSDEQFRTIERLVTTRDGETNWAANLVNLFETAEDGHQVGAGRSFREMFNNMHQSDYALLEEQWGRTDYSEYGTDFAKAVENSNLSDMNKWLFQNFYNVPFEQRDVTLIEKAARHIVETYGPGANADQLLLYSDVVGGTSEAAKQARANLLNDKAFTDRFEVVFQNAPGWQDYLVGSTVSLNTTVTQNTDAIARFFGGGITDEAIEYDLSMAKDDERAAFIAGKSGTGTPEQIAFYNQLNETFKQKGSAEQAAIWADVMEHGKRTIISDLATRSKEHELNEQVASMLVENMSEEDWSRLHSNDGTPTAYLTELTAALSSFAPDYQQAITDHLTKMSEAASYSEAQDLRRPFTEIFEGATANDYASPELLMYAMQHMSDTDAASYKSDLAFRQTIDAVVNPEYGSVDILNIYSKAALVFAQSMLRQADATGKAPVVGELEQIAQAMASEDTRPEFSSQMLDELMKVPDAFAQIKAYDDARSAFEDEKFTYAGQWLHEMAEDLDPTIHGENMGRLLRNERMDATYLPSYEGAFVDGYSAYSHLKDSPNKDLELSRLSAEERIVAEKIIARDGETTETDFDRLYMIGVESHRFGDKTTDAVGMMEMWSSLTETERQQRIAEYQTEYGPDSFLEDLKTRAGQENLSPEHQAVVDNFIKQGGVLLPADVAQLAVLKGGDAYKTVLPVFSELPFEARDLAKSDFAEKYGHDLARALLVMVQNNSEEEGALVAALKSSDIDPIQQYLDRVANFDNTGVDVDGTRESMLRALQINGDVIQQYSEDLSKLPPEMVQALDEYFVHTVEQNRDSKGRVAAAAQAAIDMAVIAAALVTLVPSGGTSAAIVGGILATGARAPIAAAIQGGRMITEEEMTNLLKESALEAGLFMAPGAIIRATKGFNELAPSGKLKTFLSSLTHSDEATLAPVQTSQGTVTLDPATAKWFRDINLTGDVAALDEGIEFTTTGALRPNVSYDSSAISWLNPSAREVRTTTQLADNAAALGTGDDLTKVVVEGGDTPGAFSTNTTVLDNNAMAAIEGRTVVEGSELGQLGDDAALLATGDDATKAIAEGSDTLTTTPIKPTPGPLEGGTSILDDEARAAVEGRTAAEGEAVIVGGTVDDAANATLKSGEAPSVIPAVEQGLTRAIAPAVVTKHILDADPEVQSDFTPPDALPNDEIKALATVGRGEGPWHSAERILAASGKPYGVDEVLALVKAMKVVYAQDNGSDDMSGLKVKYQFVTADNFEELLDAVDNPSVEAALRGFAMAS